MRRGAPIRPAINRNRRRAADGGLQRNSVKDAVIADTHLSESVATRLPKALLEAIESAWSPAGVVILVDLGGAETNSEMAVEMLPEDRRARVVICNAPVVEGAVIAATESSGGSLLAAVKRSAEEFYA